MSRNNTISKRRPWPYDAYISTVKVTLQPGQDGNLVSKKSKTLDATAPVTFDYGSASPYKERTALFRDLLGGMGLAVEPAVGSIIRRYKHTTRADLSIDGRWMKGPKFEDHSGHTHQTTVNASSGAVRQFVMALHGGVETLFAICDNGVYRRSSDTTWVASLTSGTTPALPGGQLPQSGMRFKARYTAAIDGLYLGTDDGNLWAYDGTTWAQAVAAQGPGTGALQGEARFLEKVGDEFWVAGNYWVVKTNGSADPMLRASYAGVIYVGDQSSTISGMRQVGHTLYVFKTNGRIYTITSTGEAVDLFPSFEGRASVYNGRNAEVWKDELWAPVGEQLVRLNAAAELRLDGLELLLDNTSPIRGRYTAGAGHNVWFMYEIYYNEITNTSYLVKHGGWVGDPESQVSTGQSRYIDVHHGTLAEWNKECTAAAVISGVHATTNDRLYVGFSDGTVQWCVLPRTSRDPSADSACEFTGLDSYVYLSEHHAKFQADNKLWQGVSVFGPTLTTTEYAQVEYRIFQDVLAAWEVLTEDSISKYTLSGQRINFTSVPPVYSRQIQIRVKLVKDSDLAASPVSLSPILDGIGVHESLRPSLSLEYVMDIHCSSFRPLANGIVDRRRGEQIRDALVAVASEVGNITIVLPDGSSEEVAVIDIQDSMVSRQKRRDLEWTVRMTFVQVRTITQLLEQPGITYSVLETYTLSELEDII